MDEDIKYITQSLYRERPKFHPVLPKYLFMHSAFYMYMYVIFLTASKSVQVFISFISVLPLEI